MAKIIQFSYYNIDGEFKKPNAYLLKYPYFYSLNGANLYRLNVISKISELIATIPVNAYGNLYNSGTELLYFYSKKSGVKYYSLYSLDLYTFIVSEITSSDFVWYDSSNYISGKSENVNGGIRIYTYYRGRYSNDVYYSRAVCAVGDINNLTGKYIKIFNEYATSGGVYNDTAPSIINDKYQRLIYCGFSTANDYTHSTKVVRSVGFATIKSPSPSYQPLDNKFYFNVSLFELDGTIYGVGGSFYGTDNSVNINDSIISINRNSLASNRVGTLQEANGTTAIIATTENRAYIVLSSIKLCVAELVEYNLTYDFKDREGNTVAKVTGKLPIIGVNVSSQGNDISVVLTYLDSSTEDVNFTLPPYNNFELSGLSDEQGSRFPMFPIGDTPASVYTDLTLYPTYTRKLVPTTVFTLELYKNKAEANRVDKTDYLTKIGTLSGALRDESSITKPVITFESLDIPVFNYVYIPVFNRYYFVNDITSIKYKLWQISMSVDPLMTYKDAIMQCVGFIDRNEHEFNAEIIDKKRVVEQGRTMEVHSVTNELFTGSEGTFSLSALNATAVNVE